MYAVWMRVAVVVALAGASAAYADGARTDSPLQRLSGSWSGSGQVQFEKGTSEQLHCRAYYVPKSQGSDLALAIRCASPSYKIEMRANLSQHGDRVTGHWEERTFNAEGAVNGRVAGTNLSLSISGPVSGTMAVTMGETGHKIDIKTTGTGLAGVSISFSRA